MNKANKKIGAKLWKKIKTHDEITLFPVEYNVFI
jgi:hypothetical protein